MMNRPYFPIFADISKKRVVVIGGGKIAARRVETLLEFVDDICVVAPQVTDRIRCLCDSGRISWKDGVYQEEVLEEADLVLAATDDAVCNEKVVEDCRERGILVNTSHQKELCDFYFPGIIRQGDLVMGICSGGMSHREVKEAREKMEHALKEG